MTDVSDYRFTDQELDAENGLYNYNARLYDPFIGRFISPDTIVPEPFNPQSLNRYSYCLNNPLVYVDPSGHIAWSNLFDKIGSMFSSLASKFIEMLAGAGRWIGSIFTADPKENIVVGPDDAGNYYPSGGVEITPSNYNPNNTDPDYRKMSTEAAKKFLLKQTGVDARNIKMPWVNAIGDSAGTNPRTGEVSLYNRAFRSFGYLASTIGHEKIHVDQYNKALLPLVRDKQRTAGTELVAYEWEAENAVKLGLTVDEMISIDDQIESYCNDLDDNYRALYNEGYFDPYKIKGEPND